MTAWERLRQLPAGTWLLVAGQSLNLTTAVIMVAVGAIAGHELAPTPWMGTIPYGIQFGAVMMATFPASMLMKRWGRRVVFAAGCGALVVAGIAGWLAMMRGSFALLVVAHATVGIYIAASNFYRFAAIDALEARLKATALSLVVAGGVGAAILGPWIALALQETMASSRLAPVYGFLSVIGLLNAGVILCWRPQPSRAMATPPPIQADRTWPIAPDTSGSRIGVAIGAAAGGYFIMNLLMVESALVMTEVCTLAQSSRALQAHVLAMFAPSFFTGTLIAWLGLRRVLTLGLGVLAAAALLGVLPVTYPTTVAALVLLGLGWNLTYVGGSVLLAEAVPEASRHRWQGMNESLIAGSATAGALLPAPALAVIGWQGSSLMVLAASMAGAVLVWRVLRPNVQTPAAPASVAGA